jgi:hypothetical protein
MCKESRDSTTVYLKDAFSVEELRVSEHIDVDVTAEDLSKIASYVCDPYSVPK